MSRELDDQLADLARFWADVVPPVTADEVYGRGGVVVSAPPTVNGHRAATPAEHDDDPVILRLEPPALRRRGGVIRILAPLIAAAAVVGGLVLVAPRATEPVSSVSTPITEPVDDERPLPEGDAPIEPGTYRVPASTPWAAAEFTITFPEGWETQYGHLFRKHSETDDEFGFYATVVDDVYLDACGDDVVATDVGPTAEDLADALMQQMGPEVVRSETTLGSYPAIELTMTVPADLDLGTCRLADAGIEGLQVWYEPAPIDNYLVVFPDSTSTVSIVDVDGQRQVVVTRVRSTTSRADQDELADILASIRFQPDGPADASDTEGSLPEGDAPIEPGSYRVPESAWAAVDFAVTFPEGWETQYGHLFRKHPESDDEFGFYATVVDDVYVDSCGPDESVAPVGPTGEDLAAALMQQMGPEVVRTETTLGSYPAIELTMTVPADLDLGTCRLADAGIEGLQVWHEAPPIDNYLVVFPDSTSTVYIVDVDGQRQVVVTRVRSTTSRADQDELANILASIRFQP